MSRLNERIAALRMRKKDFAELMGLTPEAVSRWGDSPPRYALVILDMLEKREVDQQTIRDICANINEELTKLDKL